MDLIDPMDFLENKDLLQFFHCNKTEMSCMDNPHTFLTQLRDHDLIPEDRYQKVSRMRIKENIKKGLYDILDWLERERPQRIKSFWRCVFKDPTISIYPTLRMLREKLINGSYKDDISEKVENEDTDKRKSKEVSEDEEEEEVKTKSVKKKNKKRNKSMSSNNNEEQQPGSSSQSTPSKKKRSMKIRYSSPLKGEKRDIWNWPFYKTQFPVTCGNQKGILSRGRLANGERCILFQKQWFTPTEFEEAAGKKSYKNWKLSIRCSDVPLGQLIKDGHLKPGSYRGRRNKMAKRSLFRSDVITVSEEEDEEDEDDSVDEDDLEPQNDQVSSSDKDGSTDVPDKERQMQPEPNSDSGNKVFKVTCGDLAGTLHKNRFATGTLGKSIRTETSWLTPEEFMKEASCQTEVDGRWKKDIKWEGKPLNVLIETKVLEIHSLLCKCRWCKPNSQDLENQKNDDECYTCKGKEEEEAAQLVECDHCPRSFHQKCHLPPIDDATLRDPRPWMCTFCVLQTTQECSYGDKLEMAAALSRPISRHMLECQYLLLYLNSVDEEQTFTSNPCLYLENYSAVIRTPMWLGKVADKLQEKKYQTVGEFVSDIHLIFTNCASYNRDNVWYLDIGERLKELFNTEFRRVFSILPQSVD